MVLVHGISIGSCTSPGTVKSLASWPCARSSCFACHYFYQSTWLTICVSTAQAQAPQKYLDRFPNLTGSVQVRNAMVAALDDQVGRLYDTLNATGQLDNTVIVFLSDNVRHAWSLLLGQLPR